MITVHTTKKKKIDKPLPEPPRTLSAPYLLVSLLMLCLPLRPARTPSHRLNLAGDGYRSCTAWPEHLPVPPQPLRRWLPLLHRLARMSPRAAVIRPLQVVPHRHHPPSTPYAPPAVARHVDLHATRQEGAATPLCRDCHVMAAQLRRDMVVPPHAFSAPHRCRVSPPLTFVSVSTITPSRASPVTRRT